VPRALTVEDQHAPGSGTCRTGECEHYREMVRLRRNLHDGLGPGLAGIMMRADVLTQLLSADQGAVEEMLHELRREAASFMAEFRRMLADQSPVELDGHDLGDALGTLAWRMSRASGNTLLVSTDVEPRVAGVDRAAQVAAFWIAKEALTNVVKHAKARTCAIRVWVDGGLWLEIVDNGVGGGAGGARLRRRGVGLTSMGSRATELGGWCDVSDNGFGVTVTAHLPAPSPAEEVLLS
jgi:signal transduction histidine kinase